MIRNFGIMMEASLYEPILYLNRKVNKMKKLLLIAISLSVVITACGSNEELRTSHEPEVIYRNCMSCHGQNLEGRGATPDLLNLGEQYTHEEIVDIIQHGIGRMSGVRGVSEEQANILAEWLLEH